MPSITADPSGLISMVAVSAPVPDVHLPTSDASRAQQQSWVAKQTTAQRMKRTGRSDAGFTDPPRPWETVRGLSTGHADQAGGNPLICAGLFLNGGTTVYPNDRAGRQEVDLILPVNRQPQPRAGTRYQVAVGPGPKAGPDCLTRTHVRLRVSMKAKIVFMAIARPAHGLQENQDGKSSGDQAECDHGARSYLTTGIWMSPELLRTPKP